VSVCLAGWRRIDIPLDGAIQDVPRCLFKAALAANRLRYAELRDGTPQHANALPGSRFISCEIKRPILAWRCQQGLRL